MACVYTPSSSCRVLPTLNILFFGQFDDFYAFHFLKARSECRNPFGSRFLAIRVGAPSRQSGDEDSLVSFTPESACEVGHHILPCWSPTPGRVGFDARNDQSGGRLEPSALNRCPRRRKREYVRA